MKRFPRISLGVFLDRWLGRQWDPGIVIGDAKPVELTPLQRAKFHLARDIVARTTWADARRVLSTASSTDTGICVLCQRIVDLATGCPYCGGPAEPATLVP